jgi:hypothetical protein
VESYLDFYPQGEIYMVSLRNTVKAIVSKFPIIVRAMCSEISCQMADKQIHLLVPNRMTNAYKKDPGLGELTGHDKFGAYEATFSRRFAENIHQNSVVFDIGAHYGWYGILAYECMRPSEPNRIICFEPDPLIHAVLKLNNDLFCNSYLTLDRRKVLDKKGKDCISVDRYFEETGLVPSLVKIDIEGFEYPAVKGMEMVCREKKPKILMEYHANLIKECFQSDEFEILRLLESWNYRLFYNGHSLYTLIHKGEVDPDWYQDPPDDRSLFAVWAIPK